MVSFLQLANVVEADRRPLVQDGITILREERTRTVGQNATEVTHVTIRIGLTVKNVDPFELTAVILRIEVHLVGGANRSRNHGTEHILMEDVAQFVICRLVARIDVVGVALCGGNPLERINTNDRVIRARNRSDNKPRRIRIDRVVETTVRTLDTQGGQEFIGFCPTVILPDVSIQADDALAGFSGGDQHEHRSAVLTAHGIASSAVADKLHVQPLQDTLSQLALREGVGGGRKRARNAGGIHAAKNGIVNSAGIHGGRLRNKTRSGGSGDNKVTLGRHITGILIAITFLPDERGRFGQHVHDIGQLFPTLHREAQVFEGDVGGLDRGPLQAVLAQFLPKGHTLEGNRENVAGSASGRHRRGGSARDRLGVGVKTSVILVNGVGPEFTPVGTSGSHNLTGYITANGVGGGIQGGGGEEPLESNRADHITHFIGELLLLRQLEPGGSVDRPAINLRSDTASFLNEQLLDRITSSHFINLSFHPSHARARDVMICGSSVNSTRSYSLLPHSKLFPGGIPELLMPVFVSRFNFYRPCSTRVSIFIPVPNKLKVSTGLNVSIPF